MSIKELIAELIKFRTTKDNPKELERIVDFVEDYFKQTKLISRRYERNGKHSIVITFKDTKKVDVFFVGHLDVVPAKDELFVPKVEGRIVKGRGASDMKGPSASIIQLFRELADEGKDYNIGLMLTTDEEVGGEDGVAYLLKEEGFSSNFAIVPDGALNGSNYRIINREKGVIHFKVKAKGKSAHGSTVWEGLNAIDLLVDFYNDISLIFPTEPCGINDHWHNTINIGYIHGGKAPNIIPDYAEALIDIRFVEPWNLEQIIDQIEASLKKFPNMEMEILSKGEAIYVPEDNEYVKLYREAVRRITGSLPEFSKEHGATDGRFFAEAGIPVIITHGVGGGIHADDEWVDAFSMETLKDIFKEFLKMLYSSS